MPPPFERPVIMRRNLAVFLRGLASNPSAPPEALVRLAAANIDRTELARRRDLPAQAAVVLAGDEDANLRLELAANPNLPAEVQTVLARDVDARVRGRLAEGAEYFTTVGVHGRHFPRPLSHDVYELLARDPQPKVRRALAFNRHLPDDIRAGMLDDDDARTAAIAAAEWDPAPTARIGELLSRATGAFGRELLLLRLDGPLPAEVARGMLADIDSSTDPANSAELLPYIAATADLDAALTRRFLPDPQLRAAVAANPTLAPEHVAALAHDPDNEVRAAVVARRGLDPVLRESVSVEYDDGSSGNTVEWLLDEDLSEPDQLAFARSRHQVFRKTLAMRTDLSDEAVAILAADESFAVRLFVCERQPNAPGWLLAHVAADWTSYSRWDMLAHKNFPADAATALARSDDPQDRVVAAAHPGLPIETIEALLADGADYVRRRAATNPSIPTDRLITLLEADESAVVSGAAANRTLLAVTMHQVLDQARL
ncbi:hypothetical protein [Streptomyces lavendulae]|uniref:hypothetical protein n=1 Tax=Streptomyces lavendulae TaxID=1914 RepID=UPI00255473C2|nr:hypothetical protein [Streptomyces lavendulae]